MLLCLGIAKSSAQVPNRFLLFDVKSGLTQNSVTCFFEDSKGIIWVGTQDGLNRFDGKTFQQFTCNPTDTNTLSNKYVLNIAEDGEGNLWIGTAAGLNKLNTTNGKISRVFINNSHAEKTQAVLYEQFLFDTEKNLFVLSNGLLYKKSHASKQWQLQDSSNVSRLFASPDNKHQYIIKNDSVFDLSSKQLIINLQQSLPKKQVLKAAANSRYILFYSENQSSTIDIYELKKKQFIKSIALPSKAFDIKIRNDNSIYASLNNGFMIYKNIEAANPIYYDAANPQSLPSGPILNSFVDSKNNLWIGSASSGMAVQPSSFANFTLVPSLHKNDAIQDIAQQNNDTIIASNTGVYRVANGRMVLIKSFGPNRVNAVLSHNGFIYAAVEHCGLYKLSTQGSVLKIFSTNNTALQSNQIFAIKNIGKAIALCTEKYLYILDANDKISLIPLGKDSLQYTYVLNCSTDRNGLNYVATNNGVAVLDKNFVTQQLIASQTQQDILGKTIVSNVFANNDTLFISTLDNGIFLLRNNKILKHYYLNNGLQNNVVYNIARAANGELWACTNAGIASCNKGEDVFTPISINNGLPISYYSFGSMQCQNNTILIGTDNGLYVGDVSKMNFPQTKIQAFIHQIVIDGKVLPTLGERIEIDAYKKTVEISFGHATIFDNTVFAYQLNNLPWVILPTNQKRINFSDFPLGKNKLSVKVANNAESLDAASVSEYSIIVQIPWYLRWWVIALASIVLFFTIFYAIKNYYKRKNEQKMLAYQNELNVQHERERISRDLHDNLGSYATALLSKIQQIKTTEHTKDLLEMNELGNSIISNIRETIWIMQTKDIKLQDFSDKIKNYVLKLKPIYPEIEMIVKDDITNNISLTPTTTTHLFRIIQEAIHNCVKHAQASKLLISFGNEEKLYITIQDDGIGYENDNIGEHYGIKNMHTRAAEINCTFKIEKMERGTKITLAQQKY
jgi:signal transduction histidine kinase